jgi:hypothetical protein
MMDWLAQLCGLPDKFFFKSCSSSSSSITSSSSSADGPAAAQGSSDSQQQQQQEEEEQQQRRGGGVIQGTSSEAVLVAALAARARVMKGRPAADALKLVAYGSDQVTEAGWLAGCAVLCCLKHGIQTMPFYLHRHHMALQSRHVLKGFQDWLQLTSNLQRSMFT